MTKWFYGRSSRKFWAQYFATQPSCAAKLNEGHPTLNLIDRLLSRFAVEPKHRNRIVGLRFG